MAVYQRSETYYHWITFRDRDNAVYDPSTVSITITNPCGVVKVDSVEMTNDAAGVYYYPYNLPADAVYGEWDVKVVAAEVGESSTFKDKFYILPWDAVEQIRELSGITSKKSVSDDAIARIIWEAYKEILDLVHKLRKNETFLCNPDDGDWIDGVNKVFAVKNPPIADFNGDGVVSGADGTDCDSDITLLWTDADGDCHEGKVTVNESECGNVTLTQSDDNALPSGLKSATVTYHSEWYPFNTRLFRKAVSYLAAYEAAIRFTEIDKTTQADLSSSAIKFNAQRKELYRKYRDVLRLIKRPVVAGGMLPGDK